MHVARGKEEYTVGAGHDWFWHQFADGSWEPSTFRIFDKFLEPDKTFLDIGAWIGPTTLYAAKRAKQVFAFEPDPVAYKSLVVNLELNDVKNVVPYPVAVANQWKGIPFGPKTGFGDSMSSELWGKASTPVDRGFQVPAVPLEGLVIDLMPNFIKIDIEGGEKTIFDNSAVALEQCRPTIHLSLHTPWHLKDLDGFKHRIMEGLEMYPFIYDENLKLIALDDAFNPDAFNSIVATFKEIN